MDWNSVSFVMSGKPRIRILIELKNGQKTPSELAAILKIPRSHVSKTIKELEEKELIRCLTPDRRKMKFYIISDTGKDILSYISNITSDKK
jgi:predicted transcriptional regulator